MSNIEYKGSGISSQGSGEREAFSLEPSNPRPLESFIPFDVRFF